MEQTYFGLEGGIYLSCYHDVVHDLNGIGQIKHLEWVCEDAIAMVFPHDPCRSLSHFSEGFYKDGVHIRLLEHLQCGAMVIFIISVIVGYESLSMVGIKRKSATTTYSQLPQSLLTGQASNLKEDRMFQILYVADPLRQCDTLVEAQHDLGYTTQSIACDLFDMLKKWLPRHIFARRGVVDNNANSNGSRMMWVHILEWVSDAQHCYRSLAGHSTFSYG